MSRPFRAPAGELQPFELSRAGLSLRLHPRCGPELSSAWLAAPEALVPLDAPPGRWRGASPDGAWFVKRRGAWRGHRALARSFAMGLELEQAGLPVPVHMAVIKSRRPRMAWLVTEWLPGQDLDMALTEAAPAERSVLIERTGQLVADLHAGGYRQRDLKAPNLRVTPDGGLALVDLEGVRRGATSLEREKDLGRLAASFLFLEPAGITSADWLQLVEAYCARRGDEGGRGAQVQLAARARARGLAKQASHRRSGRPSR